LKLVDLPLFMVESAHKQWSKIAAPGYRFILAGVLLFLLGLFLNSAWLALIGLLSGGFLTYFFRDPERAIPKEPDVVVAPADGKVVLVDRVANEGPPGLSQNVLTSTAPWGTAESHRRVFGASGKRPAGRTSKWQCWKMGLRPGGADRGLLARHQLCQPGSATGQRERWVICFSSRVDLYLRGGGFWSGDRAVNQHLGKWACESGWGMVCTSLREEAKLAEGKSSAVVLSPAGLTTRR
jgi:phosphatidylserine decarboxylase